MVAQSELKYTWRIPQDFWYLRFFLWFYHADKTKLTFCRWWWGTVLLPFTLSLFLVVFPFIWLYQHPLTWVGHQVMKWDEIRTAERRALREARKKADYEDWKKRALAGEFDKPVPKKPSPAHVMVVGIVTVILAGADHVSAAAQKTAYLSKKAWKPIQGVTVQPTRQYYDANPWFQTFTYRMEKLGTWTVLGVIGATALFCLGLGFYFWQAKAIESLEITGIILGGVIVLVALIAGGAFLMEKYDDQISDQAVWIDDHVFRLVGRYFFRPIGRGFQHFGHFMWFGYYTVKTRTCPRVEVIEK